MFLNHLWAFLVAQRLKHLPAMRETQVQSLVQEDPLEKEMATHSSILAWRIPWTEEPGRLQFMGSLYLPFIEFRLLFSRHGLSPLRAFLGKFSKIDRGLQVFLLMFLSAHLHKEGMSRHLAIWFLGITFGHLDCIVR